jgi:hypothetical protein
MSLYGALFPGNNIWLHLKSLAGRKVDVVLSRHVTGDGDLPKSAGAN